MMWLRTLSESLENGATGKTVRPSATIGDDDDIATRQDCTAYAGAHHSAGESPQRRNDGPPHHAGRTAESQMSSRRTREKE
jgi:hypothetical protein